MADAVLAELVELGTLLVELLVTAVLVAGGVVIERLGVQSLQLGNAAMGAWYGYMGALAFAAAVLLVTRRVLPRLRSRASV